MLLKIGKDLPDMVLSLDDPDFTSRLERAKTVALYRAADGELPVDDLARALIKKGIRVCFPKIEDGSMNFYYCPSLEDKYFETGAYKISEPAAGLEKAEPGDIDIAVIPAIAYNEEGTRLGQGGGYYDKYFAQTDALLVGVCYDFQICSELPFDEHDLTVDILLPVMTEDYEE
jgi:5-formyltetrahydrofolate cyclo-ligase